MKHLKKLGLLTRMIKRKLKQCVYCEHDKLIFRSVPGRGPQCEDCYRREKAFSKNKRKKQARSKDTGTNLTKTADKVFSAFIRNFYKLDNGYIPCYTCDAFMSYAEAQCGHFISRSNLATRWLPDNCRPQCNSCNVDKGGNLEVFKAKLNSEVPNLAEQLEGMARRVYKPTQNDLKELISEYSKRIKEL